MALSPTAVSYTHLDVYKRQDQQRADPAANARTAASGRRQLAGVERVNGTRAHARRVPRNAGSALPKP